MASPIFDTHGFVERLTAAGVPGQQAGIVAEEQARMLHEQLATTPDAALLRSDLERLEDQVAVRLGG